MFDAERGGMSESELEQMGIPPEELEVPGEKTDDGENRKSVDSHGRARIGFPESTLHAEEDPLHTPGEIDTSAVLPNKTTLKTMAGYKQESGHSVTRPLTPKSDTASLSPDQIPAIPRGESVHNPTERITAEREYDLNRLATRLIGASERMSRAMAADTRFDQQERSLSGDDTRGEFGQADQRIWQLERNAEKLGVRRRVVTLTDKENQGDYSVLKLGNKILVGRGGWTEPHAYRPLTRDSDPGFIQALFFATKSTIPSGIRILKEIKQWGHAPLQSDWNTEKAEDDLRQTLALVHALKERSGIVSLAENSNDPYLKKRIDTSKEEADAEIALAMRARTREEIRTENAKL